MARDGDLVFPQLKKENRWMGHRICVQEIAGDCYSEVWITDESESVGGSEIETLWHQMFESALQRLASTCGWTLVGRSYVCEGVARIHPGVCAFCVSMAASGVAVHESRREVV